MTPWLKMHWIGIDIVTSRTCLKSMSVEILFGTSSSAVRRECSLSSVVLRIYRKIESDSVHRWAKPIRFSVSSQAVGLTKNFFKQKRHHQRRNFNKSKNTAARRSKKEDRLHHRRLLTRQSLTTTGTKRGAVEPMETSLLSPTPIPISQSLPITGTSNKPSESSGGNNSKVADVARPLEMTRGGPTYPLV